MKKNIVFLSLLLCSTLVGYSQTKTDNDGNWSKQLVTRKNTAEAEQMIRVGDIDNLGMGFAEGFDPFYAGSTDPHAFPWFIDPLDAKGTDCILLGSAVGTKVPNCYADGYSGYVNDPSYSTKATAINIPLGSLKETTIKSAALQLFVDDFQSANFCSKFQVTLNGKRWADAEKIVNAIDQSGPIGKLITIRISTSFLPLLNGDNLSLLIDDPTTGENDGYAIDFVKLLVNLNETGIVKGKASGHVYDDATRLPIANAKVEVQGIGMVRTDSKGYFELKGLFAGLNPVDAFAEGYNKGTSVIDVADGNAAPIDIYLQKSTKTVIFSGKEMREGDHIITDIHFDRSSYVLRSESTVELDKLVAFMQAHPTVQIELSGHTSNEGPISENKTLALHRVESCKEYLVKKGIESGHIITVGHGPDNPIAANDTETNRAKNRRVEMRVMKL